jgi:hypothetical protein
MFAARSLSPSLGAPEPGVCNLASASSLVASASVTGRASGSPPEGASAACAGFAAGGARFQSSSTSTGTRPRPFPLSRCRSEARGRQARRLQAREALSNWQCSACGRVLAARAAAPASSRRSRTKNPSLRAVMSTGSGFPRRGILAAKTALIDAWAGASRPARIPP